MAEDMEPSLKNLLTQESLNWVFIGGKGGVGKTTVSCSLAIQFSKVRESVLLISTDPAHNLSDAFNQQFTKSPTLIQGFPNLYAMEVDPTIEMDDSDLNGAGGFLSEITGAIPGIDEMMSFAAMMKMVNSMKFSTIVFDTAPTGHTLRLLALPEILDKSLGKILALKSKLGGLFSQITSLTGSGMNEDDQFSKLEETKKNIEQVTRLFKDPDRTTFVAVCIPEFLSLYETERLVQELAKYGIDIHNIVVNQLVVPPPTSDCGVCASRVRMQQKYVKQLEELYEDIFHLVKLPLLGEEVRGVKRLEAFSRLLASGETVDSTTDVMTLHQC